MLSVRVSSVTNIPFYTSLKALSYIVYVKYVEKGS